MCWYLGYAKTGREFDVSQDLASEGVNVWCGRVKVRRRGSARKARVVTEPALPNYLFLNMSDDDFHAIGHKHLAKRFVALSRLGISEFERFREKINHMGIIDSMQEGAALEITSGPFEGRPAILKELLDGAENLVVSIEVFERIVNAEIPVQHVKLAP